MGVVPRSSDGGTEAVIVLATFPMTTFRSLMDDVDVLELFVDVVSTSVVESRGGRGGGIDADALIFDDDAWVVVDALADVAADELFVVTGIKA